MSRRKLVSAILSGCLVLASSAPSVATIANGLFPDARVMFSAEPQQGAYTLALGPWKKVNNQWRTERERRVEGLLGRTTLEAPERFSVEEVYQRVYAELQRHEARPLFTCRGLDCGSSAAWANNHFDVKQLYGLDQHQYYGVWELTDVEGNLFYVTTYVIQRGNQRIYVQLDQLQVPAEEQNAVVARPATLLESLKQQGYFVIPGLVWQGGKLSLAPEHVKAVAEALQHDPWLKVRVVGHDYGAGGPDQQVARSLQAAQQVQKAMIDAGVDAKRVSAHGVGSLAPAGKRGSLRVEVVPQ